MHKSYWYPTHLIWASVLWCMFCGSALLDGRMVGFIIWSVVFAVVMVKGMHIYFPYFSTLHMDDEAISRHILGFKHTSLPRDKVFVAPLHIGKTVFAVFTMEKLEHYSERDIMQLSRKHRAIMYPITKEMAADFPELFQRYVAS